MAVTAKELEEIRKQGLKALREALGPVGMIKFLQMYSDGKGDYTEERRKILEELSEEELREFLEEE